MTPDELDHGLSELMRGDAAAVPLDDFARRVTGALPKPGPRPWVRPAVLFGMTLAGCWLGFVEFSGGEFVREVLEQVLHTNWLRALPVSWLLVVYSVCWIVVSPAPREAEEISGGRVTGGSRD